MRRAALLVLLALVAVVIPASPGWAQSSQPTAAPAAVEVRADFNHDGADDLAIGAPFERVGGLFAAGAAHVLYGSAGGLTGTGSQFFPQVGGAVERNDHFGRALTAGDFDHDGFADLAVAAPLESVGGVTLAGAVSILPGSASGLTSVAGRLFTQVGGAPEETDLFGEALAAGDFNHNGFADPAVAAPLEDVGTLVDPGAVSVLQGSAAGLTTDGGRLFTQVAGVPETDDTFGFALAARDFNHNGFADLAVGAPGETVGSADHAGAVSVLNGSTSGLTTVGGRLFTQVGGAPETHDGWGAPLAAGDFNGNGVTDLAVSAPAEDVRSIVDAGAVSVLYGAAGGLTTTGGRLFTKDSPGIGGSASERDQFGHALTTGDTG